MGKYVEVCAYPDYNKLGKNSLEYVYIRKVQQKLLEKDIEAKVGKISDLYEGITVPEEEYYKAFKIAYKIILENEYSKLYIISPYSKELIELTRNTGLNPVLNPSNLRHMDYEPNEEFEEFNNNL